MDIQNFSAGYSVEEDRLLLSVQGAAGQRAYWLSRKATIILAEAIKRVLKQQYQIIGEKVATQHTFDLAEFGHDAATQALPLEGSTAPLVVSGQPTLLYQVAFSAEDATHGIITLKDKVGNAVGYRINRSVMHALLSLLQSQSNKAEWGLDLVRFGTESPNRTLRTNFRSMH